MNKRRQIIIFLLIVCLSFGIGAYVANSINKKENDSQIMTFLSKHKDMKRIFEKQIFPNEYDSDGFYICKLVKE